MDTGLLITILVVVVLVVLVAVFLVQRRRSQRLQQQFGPEYQRTVARTGNQRSAEADLAARQQRRRQLTIVALEPAGATQHADIFVAEVMRDRGYPVDDFEQRAADVSVDHPQVAENYRAAHAVYQANEKGLASTDDLRQAFVHYRSLFAQLLDIDDDGHKEAHR